MLRYCENKMAIRYLLLFLYFTPCQGGKLYQKEVKMIKSTADAHRMLDSGIVFFYLCVDNKSCNMKHRLLLYTGFCGVHNNRNGNLWLA